MKEDIIILKNGVRVKLKWNFLVLEYLEEYPGGIKALQEDIKHHRNEVKITNMFCYAAINANIEEELSYREILQLIDIKSVRVITKFIENNQKEFEEFKKKDPTSFARAKKSHTKKKKS